jgi:hypothetical protein
MSRRAFLLLLPLLLAAAGLGRPRAPRNTVIRLGPNNYVVTGTTRPAAPAAPAGKSPAADPRPWAPPGPTGPWRQPQRQGPRRARDALPAFGGPTTPFPPTARRPAAGTRARS